MADIETHTVTEATVASSSRLGDYRLDVDPTGREGPPPTELLVATYASSFAAAMRDGADRDLGRVEVETEADRDEDGDLAAVRFTVHVEADLDDEQVEGVVDRAEERCHVHTALREGLAAEVAVSTDAF